MEEEFNGPVYLVYITDGDSEKFWNVSGDTYAQALQKAKKFAKAKGIKEPSFVVKEI